MKKMLSDEDDFEKQMCLANKSDQTATVRPSPSQAQVDQLEGWLLEKPIPYISNVYCVCECE